MVGAHGRTALAVDREFERLPGPRGAVLNRDAMDEEIAELLLGAGDPQPRPLALHRARIADLTTGLAVERRLVEDEKADLAGLQLLHLGAVLQERQHDALGGLGLVAEELRRADALADAEPHRFGRGLAGAGPGGAGLLALALHGDVEDLRIDADAAGLQSVLRQVEREAVGVVEREGGLAGELLACGKLAGLLIQNGKTALQRLAEARLFEAQGLGDERLGAHQLRVGLPHLAHEGRHEAVHQRILGSEELGVPHGAPHDAAEHVAAALVRRQHAVGDEEGRGAQVIGDDAVGGLAVALGRHPGRMRHRLDERAEEIGVVVRMHALQDRSDALEAHAGVDGRPRQRDPVAGLDLLELHEDEVPELQEPVAVLVGRAGRAALQGLALVDEDLGARAAGTRIAHLPEIVGGRDADDLVVGESGDLLPQRGRVLVVVVDGDEEPVLRQVEFLRDQVPGELDGERLEVVAEREVSQHLEEGVVARRVADIVEVVVLAAGAHAFLRSRGAAVGPLLDAREDVLELHHAGIGEHQRRVVARHERARGQHLVAVLREVLEKGRPDFVDAAHGFHSSGGGRSTRKVLVARAFREGGKRCRGDV